MTSHNRKCRRLYIEKTKIYLTDDHHIRELTSRLSLHLISSVSKKIICDKTIYSNGQKHESFIEIDTCTKLRKFLYLTGVRKTIIRSCK